MSATLDGQVGGALASEQRGEDGLDDQGGAACRADTEVVPAGPRLARGKGDLGGADLVARQYRRLLSGETGQRFIATSCPAIIGYVEEAICLGRAIGREPVGEGEVR